MSFPDSHAVTVAEWHERPEALRHAVAYWFDELEDKWRLVEGVEVNHAAKGFDLLFKPGRFRTVFGGLEIYISPQSQFVLTGGKLGAGPVDPVP